MLLVELTINSVVNRVSVEGHGLIYNWRPRIIGFDAPTLAIPSDHGGFAKMSFGGISFNPLLFAGDWPPPVVCPIAIYYTDTTEAARELVFSGICHLVSFNREAISYALHGPQYDETIAASTAYNDTLNAVLTTILTAIPEITSVDTTAARAVSPNVTHTTSGVQLAADLASAIAEFNSHLIYVEEPVAYLVDLKRDNGTRSLTEFDFFADPPYAYKAPISAARCGSYSRFSSYPHGGELSVNQYHTTEANINTALDDIIAIENSPRIAVEIPMIAGNFPALGEKIAIPDTSNVVNLSSWIRARKLTYDFMNATIRVEGEGAIAAA